MRIMILQTSAQFGTNGEVVTLIASGTCFQGDYGIHIAAHELGYALGLRYVFTKALHDEENGK